MLSKAVRQFAVQTVQILLLSQVSSSLKLTNDNATLQQTTVQHPQTTGRKDEGERRGGSCLTMLRLFQQYVLRYLSFGLSSLSLLVSSETPKINESGTLPNSEQPEQLTILPGTFYRGATCKHAGLS